MKVRNVIRAVEADGWKQVCVKGSHRQFKHPRKMGLVTVPGHPNDDLLAGTLRSIPRQAGLRKWERSE